MLTRILIPLDGSPLAERALPLSARLARATGATLVLLRVFQGMPSEFVPELAMDADGVDEREANSYLAGVRMRDDLAHLAIETVILRGAVGRSIVDVAIAYQADTIVMTTHGRSGMTRRALGSVAEHVVRDAPVPVLVLGSRANRDMALPASVPGRVWSALVGLDGSAAAECSVRPTVQLLRALAGPKPIELRLVSVIASPEDSEPAGGLQTSTEARARLHAIARQVHDEEGGVSLLTIRWAVMAVAGDVAHALLDAAEHPERIEWHALSEAPHPVEGSCPRADLLVVATHGGGGLVRWARGGVVERVLEGGALPLLLVCPAAAGSRIAGGLVSKPGA